MTLRRITLQLARNPGLPAGDPSQGSMIIAPINAEGHLDVEAWRSQRKAWPIPLEELIKTEFLTEEDLNEMRGTFKFGIDNNNK